ncbi:hypothetical protein BKI49_32670 [Streptomyces sp. Tue6028]|uniref:hypothetical protein n=1 Tax=Streptomyces sp. Tue6028 TaxID=2036037 RepID=UPI000BB2D78B|nr:hypothetical protein [Streptomyces sp. Tue6028]PBC59767.1 hypothetical protein BKI49_32670 [Streptomyces sp. Tue6028]
MIFDNNGRERFLEAVTDFEAAVRERDVDRSERAFGELYRHFGDAGEREVGRAAPLLAALLPEVPPGPRGTVAVLVGACVERGADAGPCAPHVFAELAETLAAAGEFCERWEETGGGDFPDPEDGAPDPALFDRVGAEPALAWMTLPQFEMASVAMLNHAGVRGALDSALRNRLLRATRTVEEASGHPFKCLTYALLVLDEPLIVLHRPTGTGYAMRMRGIGDNFQLHTLVADVLVGGGHIPGRAPSAQEAAVCRDQPGQVHTTGSFNLVAPTGEWVWNEGTPSDIPVVDGVRLLVLDPPAYERSWPSGRFFPNMTGDLVLERVLAPEEAGRLLAGCVTKDG